MSTSSRNVKDIIYLFFLLSITCFVPSMNYDPTIHTDEHQTTWKNALETCAGRGKQLVSLKIFSDNDKDRILSKLEKGVRFWTMPMNISQVVVWAGCVQESGTKALSRHDIPMSAFGRKINLSKCLGYCLKRGHYAAIGLKADGMCMCFSDMQSLTLVRHCDRDCSGAGIDGCKNFISLYYLVQKGDVLTNEEELLAPGKCVYLINGSEEHFSASKCDVMVPGLVCQSYIHTRISSTQSRLYEVYYGSVTWQRANGACRDLDNPQFIFDTFPRNGFFYNPTLIINPDYNPEGSKCPVMLKTDEGNLKVEKVDCEQSHGYLCIRNNTGVPHGSSARDYLIIAAVVGSFLTIILIFAVAVIIYRRKANGQGLNKMIFDNRMYQEVMETDRLGSRPALRNELHEVSSFQSEENRMSNIYAAYTEITEPPFLVEAIPRQVGCDSKISQRVHGEGLHYMSSNITQLTGYTKISTITEQCGLRQVLVGDNIKSSADIVKQTGKEYETIF